MYFLLFLSLYYAAPQIVPSTKLVVIPYHYQNYRLSLVGDEMTFLKDKEVSEDFSTVQFVLFSSRLKYYMFVGPKPMCITSERKLKICQTVASANNSVMTSRLSALGSNFSYNGLYTGIAAPTNNFYNSNMFTYSSVTDWVVKSEQNGYTICADYSMGINAGIYNQEFCLTLEVARTKDDDEILSLVVDQKRDDWKNQIFTIRNTDK